MIDEYYAAHIKIQIDAAAVNVTGENQTKLARTSQDDETGQGRRPTKLICKCRRSALSLSIECGQPCGRGGMADAEDLNKN